MTHINTLHAGKLKDIVGVLKYVAEITRNNVAYLKKTRGGDQPEATEGLDTATAEIIDRACDKVKAGLWGLHRIIFNKPPNIRITVVNAPDLGTVLQAFEELADKVDTIANEIHYCLEKGWLDFATQNAMIAYYSLKWDVLKLHNLLSGKEVGDIYL